MNKRSRLYWLILPLAVLGFLLGCLLGVALPEKEEASETVPTTTVSTQPTSAPTTEPTLSAEEQMIADFLASAESYDKIKRIDLDGDGTEELLRYRNDDLIEICAIRPDDVVSLLQSYALFLCENGIIGQYSEGAGGHTAFFHQLKDGQFHTVECIVYHWHDDAWYRSPDFTANDTTLVPITEKERMEILAKYPCAEPIDRPFLQAIYQ